MSAPSDEDVVAALRGEDAAAQGEALAALARHGTPFTGTVAAAVFECLGVPRKAVQRRAADALCATGSIDDPALLGRVREASRSGAGALRWGATFTLGRAGIAEPDMIPALLDALGSDDGDRRWAAAELMVACGCRAPMPVVAALLEAVGVGNAALRKMALYVLRDLAPGTPETERAIVAAFDDADAGVRLAALSALVRIVPAVHEASALVLRLIERDTDPGVRRAAVSVLGHVGEDHEAVRRAVDAAASSQDPGLRRAAAVAQRHIDRRRG